MSAEDELLRRLRAALAATDVDVDELVASAWEEAHQEVRTALRRLMVHHLLDRTLEAIGEERRPPAPPDHSPTTAGTTVAPPAAEPVPRSGTQATYLFAVGADDLEVPDGLPQLPGGGPVRAVDAEGLRALVCDIDPATFEVINDLDERGLELLTEAARAHDTVLATLAQHAPILPLGLGTVVPDDAAVTAVLRADADALRAELERVRGYAEWAVTVRLLRTEQPVEEEPPAQAPASGRDYLEQRRSALDRREARRQVRQELADEVHRTLSEVAADAHWVERRPLEEGPPPLLHGVYLIAEADEERFLDTVAQVQERAPDALVEVSGPFPAYHFTSVALDVPGGPR